MKRAAVGLLVVLAVVLAALFSAFWVGDQVSAAQADPQSREPRGAAAVAALLQRHAGVQLRTVRHSADLADAVAGGTLLVTPGPDATPQARERIAQAARRADTVVLIRPDEATLDELAPGVRQTDAVDGVLQARCSTPHADRSDEISGPSRLYAAGGGQAQVCFRQTGGPAASSYGALARLPAGARGDSPEVIVAGNIRMFTNEGLTDVDNAAIALRVLGGHRDLTWYVPVAEAPAEQAAGGPWPPPWLGPLTLALGGSVAALMVWRGRRLGRLVTEPLPVVVAAHETTLARGHLYRRARDPGHAARILAGATRARLAEAVGLPATTDPRALATAVAAATGRATPDVSALLDPAPTSDADLARLGADLAQLEKEVRRT